MPLGRTNAVAVISPVISSHATRSGRATSPARHPLKDAKWMYQRAYSSAQSKRATLKRLAEDRALNREERRRK